MLFQTLKSVSIVVLLLASLALTGGQGLVGAAETSAGPTVHLIVSLRPGVAAFDNIPERARDAAIDSRALSEPRGIWQLSFANKDDALHALVALGGSVNVVSAEFDGQTQLAWEPANEDRYEDQQAWVDQINLPGAWNITTGREDVVVAVIDSGVSPTHPDLAGKLVDGFNAVADGGDWTDISGHGTHVAGIIAASGDNGIGTVGSAMDVKIMPIRVVDANDAISFSAIVDGIYWAIDHGADVINLSLASKNPSEAERNAIVEAINSGITVVAAAGNTATSVSYPANYPEVLSVGSVDADGNRSAFSSVVTLVDVAAPGEDIYSPHWSEEIGDSWSAMLRGRPVDGTSFSAAIVSGVAALMISVDPTLSPQRLREVLMATAVDSGDPGVEAGVGAGLVDAEAALRKVTYQAMYDTWYRTDGPINDGVVSRTWLWGVEDPLAYAYEPYVQTEHGMRLVYYYDKSRMEITQPLGDRNAPWYVTNGLLVKELITGEMQVGDGEFETRTPANVNVAGDPDDPDSPTYASFGGVLDVPPLDEGQVITQTINQDGTTGSNPAYADYGVTARYLDATLNHRVASVFWDYLGTTGIVYDDAGLQQIEPLFSPTFYATGLPITEAYWSTVNVGGTPMDVLIQCFERRCMTYTPTNPEGWQVEMGNVGQHYWRWRHETPDEPVVPPPVDDEPEIVLPEEGDLAYETDLATWPSSAAKEGVTFADEDGYHIRVVEPGVALGETAGRWFGDVSVTTTVQLVRSDDSMACLATRTQGSFSTENSMAYSLCVNNEGDLSAAYEEWNDGVFSTEPFVELEGEITPEELGEGVELKIYSLGEELWFLANGEVVGEATYDGPLHGDVGLYVLNQGIDVVEYVFRGLEVRMLTAQS